MSWEMVNLASKRICSVFLDGDWIETKDQSQDGIRLVQTGNVGVGQFKDKKNRARYISSDKFEELNCTEVLPGDLLVSRLPEPIGRSCIVPLTGEKMITSVDCTIIRTNEGVSTDFIKFYQRSERYYFELQKHVTGTTRKRISRSNLGKIKVPLPPLPEQQRIADILDKAEAITQKREQALALCDEFLRATFLDMFGDPVSNPKGWEVKNLKDIVKNFDGMRVPVKSTDRRNMQGVYPYYGASGIIDYVDDYIYEGEYLLIGEDGANLLTRSTEIAFIASGKYWVNNHAHVLKAISPITNLYLKFSINLRSIESFVTGSAQPKLNQQNLNRIPIQIPNKESIQRFTQVVEKVNTIKARIQHAQELPLFDALSQQAFKGELTQ